jgi:hypothetical protein
MSLNGNIASLKDIQTGSKIFFGSKKYSEISKYLMSEPSHDNHENTKCTMFLTDSKRDVFICFEKKEDIEYLKEYYGNISINKDDRERFKIPEKFKYGRLVSSSCKGYVIPTSTNSSSILPLAFGLLGSMALLSKMTYKNQNIDNEYL